MVKVLIELEIPNLVFSMVFGDYHEYTKANLENLIKDHLKWGIEAKVLEIPEFDREVLIERPESYDNDE